MIKPNLFFATPVWTIQLDKYEDINEEMYRYIKVQQNHDKIGINKSNVKGWHSNDFNLNDKAPQNFISFITKSIEQIMIDMNWDRNNQVPNALNAQINAISPKEGALVLFPSYLDHSVNENLSNNERIVVSFNIRISTKTN